MKKILLLTLLIALTCGTSIAQAQSFSRDDDGYATMMHHLLILKNIQHDNIADIKYRQKEIVPEDPVEPQYKQVKFINQTPYKTLSERIDRLAFGILTDIPPEYDHYGHEIRRYMKNILTPNDLNDPIRMTEKVENAKKARIVLDYWGKYINKEFEEIQKTIDTTDVTNSARTTFKYHQRIVNKFIQDQYAWIDSNLEFLEYLQSINGEFQVNYPFYDVPDPKKREKVAALYEKRQNALREIMTYTPFRLMIY